MARILDLRAHPDFTVAHLEALGWQLPKSDAESRKNLQAALDYFQRTVPRQVLREKDDGGPWNVAYNGTKIRLFNWLQGIDFSKTVDQRRFIRAGELLFAFKDPRVRIGTVRGNWYTLPGTKQGQVAIHSTQTRKHRFCAKTGFTCLQSTVSDAHVAWVAKEMQAEYRSGGGTQLFIWNADHVLSPA